MITRHLRTRDDLASSTIDGVEPISAVAPSSEDELREVVGAADGERLALYPRGGGTRIGLGGIPARPGMVVDMTRLNRVAAHNAGDLTATFQAGANMRMVAETLAQQGQMLALDSPLPARSTIGGTLATGLSGALKWHMGHARDTVIGMRVVQPNGSVTKSGGQVVKNVSGYDMSRLHIGGLGSLGVILEASFKLTPIPMYERTIVASFDSLEGAMDVSMSVFNSHVMPLALASFGDSTARLMDVDPARPGSHVAFRLGGRPRTLDRQVDDVVKACREARAAHIGESPTPRLWRAISDFGWDADSLPDLGMRITALPRQTGDVIAAVEGCAAPDMEVSWLAHPGFGTVEGAWLGANSEGASAEDLIDIISEARRRVLTLGGWAIVLRCPTEVKRRVDVWGGEPRGSSVMRELKAQYDPNDTMNPGRYVGGI